MPTEPVSVLYTLQQAQDDVSQTAGIVDRMGEALTQTDVTDAPNNPASGQIAYSSSGHQKYASADGNEYNTGRYTVRLASDQTLSATGYRTIMSIAVGTGIYEIHAIWYCVMGGGTGQFYLNPNWPSLNSNDLFLRMTCNSTSNNSFNTDQFLFSYTWTGSGGSGGSGPSGNIGANSPFLVHLDGNGNFSSAGTFIMQSQNNGTNNFTVKAGSQLSVLPVT